jgi:hypothetical protein
MRSTVEDDSSSYMKYRSCVESSSYLQYRVELGEKRLMEGAKELMGALRARWLDLLFDKLLQKKLTHSYLMYLKCHAKCFKDSVNQKHACNVTQYISTLEGKLPKPSLCKKECYRRLSFKSVSKSTSFPVRSIHQPQLRSKLRTRYCACIRM